VKHGVSGIQYPDSYQQPFDPRYGRGYGAPTHTPPQQPLQPNLFVPPQATQVAQTPQVCHDIMLHLKKKRIFVVFVDNVYGIIAQR